MEADRILELDVFHPKRVQQQEQQQGMGSTGSSGEQRNKQRSVDAVSLREKLLKLQVHEDDASKLLSRIFETSSMVREGIPGGQSRGGVAETRMLGLGCQLDEAGPKPADVLHDLNSAQARTEVRESKTLVACGMVAHGASDGNTGKNSNHGGEVGYRLNMTVEDARDLQRALLACEARQNLLDDAMKDALGEFRALVAEADHLDEEAKTLKVEYEQDAPYSPPPSSSVNHDVRRDWYESREYDKFLEKTSRLFGKDSDEYFVATEVVSQQHRSQEGDDVSGVWAKPAGKLGSGTFGTVNQLDVPTLDKSFAAKEANTVYGGAEGEGDSWVSEQCRVSLATEMVIHASMEPHSNIAQLVGVDDRDVEKMVVLLELADGDFHSYAIGQEMVSVGLLMRLLADVARGLEFLGQHGFGHNDMKPGNVLVYRESGVLVAKITDLGCALSFGEIKKGEGTIGGRPPEGTLDRRLPCEASQDVFALGHTVLLTLTKLEWKNSNMWVSEAVLTAEDKRICAALSKTSSQKYLEDVVTPRNQLDPRARATLLKLEHLEDTLGDVVKERVVDLLVRALSPDPAKRPSMSEMLAELSDLDSYLLEVETQGGVPFETVATSAVTPAVWSEAEAASAMEDEPVEEGMLRAAGTNSEESVARVQALPLPVHALPEVSSSRSSGSRDAAMPEVIDAAALMLADTPSVRPILGESTSGVGGALRQGDRGENNDGGLSALAFWPSAMNEGVAAPRTHPEASTGLGSAGTGGGGSVAPMANEGELAHAVNAAAGGDVAVMLGYPGEGGGGAVPMAAVEVSQVDQAPAPESRTRFSSPMYAGEVSVLRGGTFELRGVEHVPRAVMMNDAAQLTEQRTAGGGGGADGYGGGRDVPHLESRLKPGTSARQIIDAVLDTVSSACDDAAAGASAGGAGRSSRHPQRRHKPRASKRHKRAKRHRQGTRHRREPDASCDSASHIHHHHHHLHHLHFHPLHYRGAFQGYQHPAATGSNGTLPQPGAHFHCSWGVRGGMVEAVPCYPPGPPAWPPLQAPVYYDPWYAGSGCGSGGIMATAPGPTPAVPWGPLFPFTSTSVAGESWLPRGQAAGGAW